MSFSVSRVMSSHGARALNNKLSVTEDVKKAIKPKDVTLPKIVDDFKETKKNLREIPSVIPPITDAFILPTESFVAGAVSSVSQAVEQKKEAEAVKTVPAVELNPNFAISGDTFIKYKGPLSQMISTMKPFHVAAFLSATEIQDLTIQNEQMMKRAIPQVSDLAARISKEEGISLHAAFQKIVGLVDFYDQSQIHIDRSGTVSKISTFGLRSAILLASHQEGAGLNSWEVYTGAGKPKDNIWPFVENWKNWVPEAQGSMAKFTETTLIKADSLAKKHTENHLVLLKGGFGAGKTRQTNEIYKDEANGVISPDKGKNVVRRSMKEVPHSAAHVQGSQLAYGLFEELSVKSGTYAYDSSLWNPNDVARYIEKAEKAGKKVLVYDVQRNDIARILSVLKRDVGGEDPRIPLKMIVDGAIRDKTKRIDCMNKVLNHMPKDPSFGPEYHFIGSDAEGWNSKKVAILTQGKVELLEDGNERLNLQGINVLGDNLTLEALENENDLKSYYDTALQKSVSTLLNEISAEEKEIMENVFSKREISFCQPNLEHLNRSNFHSMLKPDLQKAWTKSDVDQAFSTVSDETIEEFIKTVKNKTQAGMTISYLDLPLAVALEMHQALKTDPWK